MKILEINKVVNGKSYNAEEFYLDYFNNFITTKFMAEYYSMSLSQCENLIEIGRSINRKR